MADEKGLHCPEGHTIIVETSPEYIDGEWVTRVVAYGNVPHCELCQEIILILRQDPGAFDEEE